MPINVVPVTSTIDSVTFKWDVNSDNGGTPVRDYLIYWDAGDDTLPVDDFTQADHTTYLTKEHTEPDLTMSAYYRFYVIARNDAG